MLNPLRTCLALVLALVGMTVIAPSVAAAQCTEEPCGTFDNIAPTISFSPTSGSLTGGPRSVTVNWSDNILLDPESRVIVFQSDTVTGSFSYTETNNWTASSSAMVTIWSGTNTLTAEICDQALYGANCTTSTATYTGPTPSVRVTPELASMSVATGTDVATRYRVVNTGTGPTIYTLTVSCPVGWTNCTRSTPTLVLSAGDSAWVDVTFKSSGAGSGSVQLTAAASGVSSAGSIGVTAMATPDPGYPGDAQSLLRIERGACVTVSLAPGVASECGDLRIVHPLPSVRVLNKARTPVLAYNSDHARPHPVVAAQFAGPAGSVPDRVRGVLKVNGVTVADTVWPGWGSTQTRRIALSFNASSYATGLYPYELVVTAEWSGGTQQALPQASRSGRMIIVNRSSSPFGAGWWLAGVERLALDAIPGDTLKLWIGGDGSARLYRGNAGGPWRAEGYTRPDSIYQPAGSSGYVRTLPGGAKVHFGATGNHVATETSVGHVTRFSWISAGSPAEQRLDTLTLPTPSGQTDTLRYLFEYGTAAPGCGSTTTALTRVRSPGPVSGYRDSWICGTSLRRVLRIHDPTPDTASVTFAYSGGSTWINRRTDRNNVTHTLGYLRVRFNSSALPLNATDTAQTRVQAVQTLGMYGVSVRADSVMVHLDGPRPGAVDRTWWTVDRLGAPLSMRNPKGHVTTLRRGDSRWPGLVTETVAPNGFTTTAIYDALGFLSSTTAWNPYDDQRNPTTSFQWNASAAAPTAILSPESELTLFGYDAYGRREWQQVGTSTSRRVEFDYHSNAHTSAPGLLEQVVYPGGVTDRVEYNTRGNLSATVSPMGARSEIESDRLGRVKVQRVAIDTLGGFVRFQDDSTSYDSIGRVAQVVSFAPSLQGEPEMKVTVVNGYDRESRLTSVSRTSSHDPALIGTITTRWAYDLAGRRILEFAPDNTPANLLDNPRDSTVYDSVGNVTKVFTRRYTDANQRVVVEMRYDTLNRLTRRIIPEIRYDSIEEGLALRGFIYPHETVRIQAAIPGRTRALPYPWYPNDTNWGYRIPGDTARFTYDVMGNVLRADNRDAWIRRSYYPGGALRGDTLKIRTVDELSAGGDSTSHVYGLEHFYDRSGRRVELKHPHVIAPRTAGVLQDRTRFTFDAVTGALEMVTDPLNNTFLYHYGLLGQVDSVSLPGQLRDVYEYDLDGRLTRHLTRNGYASGPDRYSASLLRDERFRYDTRGKVIFSGNVVGAGDTTVVTYTGLGHVYRDSVRSRGMPVSVFGNRFAPASNAVQDVRHDALGNLTGVRNESTFALPWRTDTYVDMNFSRYQAGTGRLRATDDGYGLDVQRYDQGGNLIFSMTDSLKGFPTGAVGLRDKAMYYGGDGMLHAAETRVVDDRNSYLNRSTYRRSFEEYRYDALGRRVWVRARRECSQGYAGYCELGWVRRTVWDGDRELYEIQAPSGSDYDNWRMEYDTLRVTMHVRDDDQATGDIDPNPFYGRVVYTYGAAIDQPLSVVRMGYGDMRDTLTLYDGNTYRAVEPFAIVPLWNSRGQAGLGAFANGQWRSCVGARCIKLNWPEQWAGYARPQMFRDFWHGTLLQDKQDGSGLNYRRNRYYDPATGRFTQEDPIGLAGGMNVYGFGEGDPVNYGDPFGLRVCFKNAGEARDLLPELEQAIGARITVGTDHCVESVEGGSGHEREAFDRLVSSRFTYTVTFAPYRTGSRYTVASRTIEIDRRDAFRPYPAANGTRCIENEIFTLPQVLAHELAHAYTHDSGGFDRFHTEVSVERTAMFFENTYNVREGRPQRCRY